MFGSSVGVLIHEAPVDRCSLQNGRDGGAHGPARVRWVITEMGSTAAQHGLFFRGRGCEVSHARVRGPTAMPVCTCRSDDSAHSFELLHNLHVFISPELL